MRRVCDPGLGDHGVEPPQLGHPLGDRRLQRGRIPDVRLAGDDPPAELLHLPHRLVQVRLGGQRVAVGRDVRAQVHGDDVGALRGEPDRMGPALTARGPGDEDDLVLHSTHGGLLPSNKRVA